MGVHNVYRKFLSDETDAFISVRSEDDDYVTFTLSDGVDSINFHAGLFLGLPEEFLATNTEEFLATMESIKFAANAAMDAVSEGSERLESRRLQRQAELEDQEASLDDEESVSVETGS